VKSSGSEWSRRPAFEFRVGRLLAIPVIGQGGHDTYENLGVVAFLVGLSIYQAPAIEAKARRREDALTIFLINLALGWTVVGWFAALVLAHRRVGERRLSRIARRSRQKAARSPIDRIMIHAHDCPIFEHGAAKARCVMLVSWASQEAVTHSRVRAHGEVSPHQHEANEVPGYAIAAHLAHETLGGAICNSIQTVVNPLARERSSSEDPRRSPRYLRES
jgi:hypothetical protein